MLLVGSHSFSMFSLVLSGSQWFSQVVSGSCRFSLVLNVSQRFFLVLIGSQWFLVASYVPLWVSWVLSGARRFL